MRRTIAKLQSEVKTGYNTMLFETAWSNMDLTAFLPEDTDAETLDMLLLANHATRVVYLPPTGSNLSYENFVKATEAFFKSNSYKYATLYQTIIAEYDPIQNYNSTETHTETHSGEDKNVYGSKTDTQQTPEIKVSNQYGKQVSTTGVTAFDRVNFKNAEQTTQDTHTDSTTQAPVTTTLTQGGKTDITDHGHVIQHEIKKSGNIGVTTSQQMLQSSRDLANFSLAEIIINDWLDMFALGIWESCDNTHCGEGE